MTRNFFEEQFGLDDAVYRRVMEAALARGGDYCDLYFQQRTSSSMALEDNEVNRAFCSVGLGVGIRVLAGDATGYAFCEDMEQASMLQAASVAAAIASGGATKPPQQIVATALPDYYPIQRRGAEVSAEEKLPALNRVNERAFSRDSRVRKVRISMADAQAQVLVVDSEGRKAADFRPMTMFSVACSAQDGERREDNSYQVGGRHGWELYTYEFLDEMADEAVRRTALLFEASRPGAGEMPVVLAAGSSGILLHEAIGHGMEADFNRKRISIYSDRLGKSIAQPFVSIVDDGTLESARGSINVDDEGNASQRTVLVQDGVLRTFMHDRISARHFGVEPTGNGRRQSFRHMPLPRMRSTYMLPGPHTKEEIIASVDRGIYAVTFTNGQVQIGAGDFTFYIKTGYLIEDGKLTSPIKDVNIIGNGPQALENVTMVADDLEVDRGGWTCGKDGQGVPVSIGLPTIKVSAITVGGVG